VQQLLDLIPAVIFEYTAFANGSRRFTYINPYCKELLGRTSESIITTNFQMKDFIHPDDWDAFEGMKEAATAQRRELRWEGRIVLPSGEIRWVELMASPSHVHESVIWRGLMNEVTLRKKLEQQQREAENRYRDLLESIPVGVGIHRGGRLVYANRQAVEMMGATTTEQLLSRPLIELIHPAYQAMALERIQRVMRGETVPLAEEKLVRLDGQVIDVEIGSKSFIFNGEPAIQIIVKNITQQKQAAASVRKAETMFSQLFQNSPLAIVMLDGDGNVVRINQGFQQLFGYSIEELQGKGLNSFIVPKELETEGNEINTVISSYQVVRLETTRVRKDGRSTSVILYGVPVRLEDETIGIFGVYVDITDIRHMEEELKTRNAELDNFVYKVSHDLRAPLTSVLGLVHLSQMAGNTDSPLDYLKRIGAQVQQLDTFISDVLSHSKNLKMDVKIEQVELASMVKKAFADLSYLEGADQVTYTIQESGGSLYSDPWRLSEVVRNLVSNSIKYRKETGDTQVTVRIETTTTQCTLVFSDTGQGIESDKLPQIFEMFYRASNRAQGSGLGLYIVKNAIDRLQGKLQVESVWRTGTTFTIQIPNHPPQ
jgi:PAS domain S-box-containing protein